MKPRLALVTEAPLSAVAGLEAIVPELIAAEAVVARLRRLMDMERTRLAKERGVAFIREESVRREFGGDDLSALRR